MTAKYPAKLAPYAANETLSQGRRHAEPLHGHRNEYQRDRDRIIHSSAFRRLEYKTQVFVNHEGDLFRTRLTHSLEVAQIARSTARALALHEDLVEAISLAHDLGHTPFGHAGQDALNDCMRDFGGFEHNLQSLRVVDILEEKYAEFDGLNLMFETREGILKHCSKKNAQTLGDVGRRFLDNQQPGLEAQLANLCDEIAYNNHDIDDGLRSGLITMQQLLDIELFKIEYETVNRLYPHLAKRRLTHEIVRRMINRQVTDLVDTSLRAIEKASPHSIEDVRRHREPLIRFSDELKTLNLELQRFLRAALYKHERVQHMSSRSQKLIKNMFGAYMNKHAQLPEDHRRKIDNQPSPANGEAHKARVIADYIAGMTDRFAIAEHTRLFGVDITNSL